VGDPRFDSGVKDHTYWSHEVVSGELALSEALSENLTKIRPCANFLREFKASGGDVEYFIGWFASEVSAGETLGSDLLQQLAELQIDLALDVYGNSESKV
jgi:hypothetical protein